MAAPYNTLKSSYVLVGVNSRPPVRCTPAQGEPICIKNMYCKDYMWSGVISRCCDRRDGCSNYMSWHPETPAQPSPGLYEHHSRRNLKGACAYAPADVLLCTVRTSRRCYERLDHAKQGSSCVPVVTQLNLNFKSIWRCSRIHLMPKGPKIMQAVPADARPVVSYEICLQLCKAGSCRSKT